LWKDVVKGATHHHLDKVACGCALGVPRLDRAAVSQHSHPLGDGQYLAETVADVDDRDPARLQRTDDRKQVPSLVLAQRGGWLVEHHDPRTGRHDSRDLDELALADWEVRDHSVRIDTGTDQVEGLPGGSDH